MPNGPFSQKNIIENYPASLAHSSVSVDRAIEIAFLHPLGSHIVAFLLCFTYPP